MSHLVKLVLCKRSLKITFFNFVICSPGFWKIIWDNKSINLERCRKKIVWVISFFCYQKFLAELKMDDLVLLKWTVLLPWVVNPKLSSRSTTIIDFLNGNPLYKCRSTLTQASPFKPKGRSTIVHDRPLWLSRLSA